MMRQPIVRLSQWVSLQCYTKQSKQPTTKKKRKRNRPTQVGSNRVDSLIGLCPNRLQMQPELIAIFSDTLNKRVELNGTTLYTDVDETIEASFFFLVRSNPILSKKCDSWLTCNSTPEWDRISFNLPMLVTANWRFVFVGLISAEASQKHIV